MRSMRSLIASPQVPAVAAVSIGQIFSAKMLARASERLRPLNNVRLIRLQSVGLGEYEDNSFDIVYATHVVGHLDEMDRWRYVEED